MAKRLSTFESLKLAFTSKRLAVATFLMFSSGMPLGLVWIAVPVWIKDLGLDIRVVGLFTLAQAPWSFKFLWSPLLERFDLPFVRGRRGYILAAQIALVLCGLALAAVPNDASSAWIIGVLCVVIAIVSATQDIALDAFTVDILHDEEHGLAVGARTMMYRVGMNLSGAVAITLAGMWGWGAVNLLLGLCYIPCMALTLWAEEPERRVKAVTTMKAAVWEPMVSLLSRPRALEILAFVIFFKLADNMAQSLQRPFFREMGFSNVDVGIVTGTISTIAISIGSVAGGLMTNALGLGRALWISGALQALSNLGYAWVAKAGAVSSILYFATAFEYITSGLGTGAFGVLLLRLTEKRFSATQYALLSSLFTLPRIFAGPPTGVLVSAIGWFNFFVLTITLAIPGLYLLSRFVPWNVREPAFAVDETAAPPQVDGNLLLRRSAILVIPSAAISILGLAFLEAMKAFRTTHQFPVWDEAKKIIVPSSMGSALNLGGALVTGVVGAFSVAIYLALRASSLRPKPQPH